MPSFHRIVAPTDFSEGARGALEAACELAATFGAALLVVHVYRPPIAFTEHGARPGDEAEVRRFRRRIEAELERCRDAARGRGVFGAEVAMVEGDAATAIVKVAAERGCDLIVLGSHGHTGERARLGSVAVGVVATAPCSVLVVGDTPAHAAAA